MKNHTYKTIKLMAVAQIFVLFILAGCTQSLPATICHASGDPKTPYEVVTVNNSTEVKEHLGHPNDILASPDGGCPTTLVKATDGKISICHANKSEKNPYKEATVSVNGLNGHAKHVGDIIPTPDGGCPTSPLAIVEGKVTICHITGNETDPYKEITVRVNGLNGHVNHEGDIIPAPEGGCPTSPLVIVDKKITICHATSSEKNPYNEITVSVNGLNGHVTHESDIIPAPEGGCPTSPLVIVDKKITICHATSSEDNPYEEITVSVNGLNGHVTHKDDIIPAPVGGCPTISLVIVDGKISICHVTNSEKNPYNEITVSVNGLNGHVTHVGDLIPAPEGGCPTTLLKVDKDNKITICHATGSDKNPYNEITVSINGLNGHAKHEGDIIPAPAGSCPAQKQ